MSKIWEFTSRGMFGEVFAESVTLERDGECILSFGDEWFNTVPTEEEMLFIEDALNAWEKDDGNGTD